MVELLYNVLDLYAKGAEVLHNHRMRVLMDALEQLDREVDFNPHRHFQLLGQDALR